jgi:DNA-binding transcriptional regulator YiaG
MATTSRAFTLPEMLLITVLRARFRISLPVLAELFGVSTNTIAKAERQLKPLLDQRKHTTTPTGIRFRTLTELINYAATHGITLTPGIKAAR